MSLSTTPAVIVHIDAVAQRVTLIQDDREGFERMEVHVPRDRLDNLIALLISARAHL